MSELTTLLLKLPRNQSVTPEATQTFLSALLKINPVSTIDKLLNRNQKPFALEIISQNQEIQFAITAHVSLIPFIESQLQSSYPLVVMQKIKDPLEELKPEDSGVKVDVLKVFTSKGNNYPIATYDKFTDIDPMSSILSVLSKAEENDLTVLQIALESVSSSWQAKGETYAKQGEKREDGTYAERPDASVIKEKISYPGFLSSIRVISSSKKTQRELSDALGAFARSDGNSFVSKNPNKFNLKPALKKSLDRQVFQGQVLNIAELATLWHLPSEKIKTPGVTWGVAVLSEPPNNLPAATEIQEEEKTEINFFARTQFHNKETIFGIKDSDRLRHIWTVGKTGTGKSTMIANMAIDDLKKGRGVAILDPHGDLCEDVLNYIPKSRINNTIYFNPADKDFPIVLNPLEVTNREEAELVVSGLMSIFTKVWANVWSARMEYILRNSFMTMAEVPGSTLEDVLKLLSNQSYRNKVLSRIEDKALVDFWKNEYEKMPDRLQKEAIAPIQNKVGQFVTSPMIRRIIGTPKSTVSLDDVMNGKKIFLANLSQGKLGEDNSALLGAMLITKFQLAAMRRVDVPKEERTPFYLYVDEFQNFATDSFIKILSEARKFGLALTLANQYMGQLPENITKAILGNAGSLISFSVGANDAAIIHKEYSEVFSEGDLVNLQNFQIALKLMIDGHTSRPFLATTLPLPKSVNQNREKVIRVSRERYAKKMKPADEEKAEDNKMEESVKESVKVENQKQGEEKPDTKAHTPPAQNENENKTPQSDNSRKLDELQSKLQELKKEAPPEPESPADKNGKTVTQPEPKGTVFENK